MRAFIYRAGVRVQGTIVACDATSGSDLIFLSHAAALDARAARALPRARHGRRQILTTETTLALLGTPGERLRAYALLASPGRPFVLGDLRVELFPSGHAPGATSLLCERGTAEGSASLAARIVYAGVIGPDDTPAVRQADALCLDATFGARQFVFPPVAEALAQVRGHVLQTLSRGGSPIVLVDAPTTALPVAATLIEAGVLVRAARSVVQAAAAYAHAGLPAPALQRFDGRLRPGEALLWPPEARDAAQLGRLDSPTVILASGRAADPAQLALARADHGVALTDRADFAGLLRYAESTGAREVALVGAPGDDLARALQERGVDVYPVGPPRQIALFSGVSEEATHVVSGV